MVDNKLLKIFQVIILVIGIFILGRVLYEIIFVKLSVQSKILRGIFGTIGLAIWVNFLIYIIRKFKKYF